MGWADLHLHSPHSIAVSPALTPQAVDAAARVKGIAFVATGDALHPAWRARLAESLRETSAGFYRLRGATALGPRFVVGGEVNCRWMAEGRKRQVHFLYFLPSLDDAARLAAALSRAGNLLSDGRPALALFPADFIGIARGVAPSACVVAAHLWTPWFGLLGSRAGFSSAAQALGGAADGLCAVETGLSADPAMCRRVSDLDPYPVLSFSDAHGPMALGREATRFSGVETFEDLARALRTGAGIVETLEFFPTEGKYYHDGHRRCGVSFPPGQAPGLCPACGKPLTRGVLSRVEELANRTESEACRRALPHRHVVPLAELAALTLGAGKGAKAVGRVVEAAVAAAGSEIAALTEADPATLGDERLARAVSLMRAGRLSITPGYDGVYGKVFLPE